MVAEKMKDISELENNLINITTKDMIYRIKANELSREFISAFQNWAEGNKFNALFYLIPQMKVLATDAYYTHYSVVPLLRSSENPDNILENTRKFFKEYVESSDYKRIKPLTTLNDDMSKIYALALAKSIIMKLRDELNKKGEGDKLDKLSEIYTDILMNQGSNALENGTYQLNNQQKQIVQQVIEAINKNVNMEQVLATAIKDAENATRNADEVMKLIGGKEAGKEAGTFEKVLGLTLETLWNVDFKTIIDTAGKIAESMPHFVSITKERDKHGDELYGYRTTRKPWEALARDLALPDEVFEAKLLGNGLLAREKVVTKEGAYYVIIDKSGSMMGEKTRWARSVALALFKLARMKKRKYFLRFFDFIVHPDEPISDPFQAIEYILKIGSDGGTSIDTALSTALKDLKERKLSEHTNTIIIITDGEDEVTIPVEAFKENNATLVAIMIQGDNYALKKIAEATGGKYLKAVLDREGALKVIEEVK